MDIIVVVVCIVQMEQGGVTAKRIHTAIRVSIVMVKKKCVAKLGTKAKCTADSQCKNNKCRGLDGKKECSDGGNGHTCYYESHCQSSYRCSKRSDGYKRCIPKLGLKQKCSAHSECSNNNCRGGKEHTKECSNGDRGHTCYYTDRDCNGSLKCKWVGNDYKRCEY